MWRGRVDRRDAERSSPPPAPLGLLATRDHARPARTGLLLRRRGGRARARRAHARARAGPGDSARPGARCGSAPTRGATSRPRGSTPRDVSSTSTTRDGASAGTRRSSSGWRSSGAPCRRCAGRVRAALRTGEPSETAVLACAVRLLDVGLFRIGSEQYADDDHGIGLATVRRDHVRVDGDSIVFDYPAKGGVRRVHAITDPLSRDLIETLRRRRSGPEELLAYRTGRGWYGIRSEDVNEYLKSVAGEDFSRQGLPDLERDGARCRVARSRCARCRHPGGPQAGDQRRRSWRERDPRQHAGRRAALVHRSAGVRPLPLGVDDRRCARAPR